jgi:ketosteroid isomerase-like protein
MTSGDTAAVARFYTDTAYFAETGSPTLRGRREILAATADVFACCKYVESNIQLELSEITGDRAYQFGTYRDVIEPTGQPPIIMHGRLAAVLQRDGASTWRIDRLLVVRDSSARPEP